MSTKVKPFIQQHAGFCGKPVDQPFQGCPPIGNPMGIVQFWNFCFASLKLAMAHDARAEHAEHARAEFGAVAECTMGGAAPLVAGRVQMLGSFVIFQERLNSPIYRPPTCTTKKDPNVQVSQLLLVSRNPVGQGIASPVRTCSATHNDQRNKNNQLPTTSVPSLRQSWTLSRPHLYIESFMIYLFQ